MCKIELLYMLILYFLSALFGFIAGVDIYREKNTRTESRLYKVIAFILSVVIGMLILFVAVEQNLT